MIIKSYFSKNNTIVHNDLVNTARNPVTELFYGGISSDLKYSRFIFHFDESRLKSLYTGNTFPDITKMKHTLKMVNTGSFDTDLLGATVGGGYCGPKVRTTSFDLNLFKINQFWDEGIGYDYGSCDFIGGVAANTSCASNWIYSQTNVNWSGGSGVYSGSSSGVTIGTQHFDLGNENLEIDITNAVNAILTGETNYGFGIAYPRSLEETPTVNLQYVGFFTRHTQTAYEPYIETSYSEKILDDRSQFYLDKPNKLYLYVNLGNKPTDLDTLPTVTIKDDCDVIYSAYTSSAITHVTKGVYSIDIQVPTSNTVTDSLIFTDTWSNIIINGVTRPEIDLQFPLLDSMSYYNIGADDSLPKEYGLSVTGIKRDEKIIRGDIRKVIISARVPYTVDQKEIIDLLQYRLYVKEGKNELTVIDYEDVERTFNNNYFLVDTASLIPNSYYMDIKLSSNLEVRNFKDVLKFKIASQSELRDSQ